MAFLLAPWGEELPPDPAAAAGPQGHWEPAEVMGLEGQTQHVETGAGGAGREGEGRETSTRLLFKAHQEAPGGQVPLQHHPCSVLFLQPCLPQAFLPIVLPHPPSPRGSVSPVLSSLPTDKPRLLYTDGSLPTCQLQCKEQRTLQMRETQKPRPSPVGISPWCFQEGPGLSCPAHFILRPLPAGRKAQLSPSYWSE